MQYRLAGGGIAGILLGARARIVSGYISRRITETRTIIVARYKREF